MGKLRKIAAIVFALLFNYSPLLLKAQNPSSYYVEDPHTFFGGLLLGGNFSQVDGDSYAGYHKAGINVGGIMYARLDEELALSMELLYSQKGSRGNRVQESGWSGVYINTYKINLNYVEIPLQINYFDKRKSHFGAGFSYSQLLSSKEEIVVDDGSGPRPVETDTFKFFKGDVNFILAGNLHLKSGLFLNLRFQYSIMPIRKDIPPGYGRSEQFNNLWALRLMYIF